MAPLRAVQSRQGCTLSLWIGAVKSARRHFRRARAPGPQSAAKDPPSGFCRRRSPLTTDNHAMRDRRRVLIASLVEEAWRDVTALGNPAILFAVSLLVAREWWLGILLGLAAVEAAGRAIKLVAFVPRPRPAAWGSVWEKSDAGSFPSIHAARAVLVCAILYAAVETPMARALLVAMPVAVGLSRVMLRTHRWWDVAAGWSLGYLAALVVWRAAS